MRTLEFDGLMKGERVARLCAVVVILLLAGRTARAQEAVGLEAPVPSSVEEQQTSIGESFEAPKERVRLTDLLKDYLKDQTPFLRDSKLLVNLRSYYFRRDQFDDSLSQAAAIGGSLGYKSGYLFDTFGIGVTGYTSQPLLYAPKDETGTLLLEPDTHGYSVVGQLYGEFKLGEEARVDLYRKDLNTPFINRNDNRMTPNTFEGYTLTGSHAFAGGESELRYGGGWVTKIKERNSEHFVPMSEDAGAPVDRGVAVAGFNYKTKNATLGAIEYFSEDVLNIVYSEAKYSGTLPSGIGLLGSVQYTDQRSTGSDALSDGDYFSTNQLGVKVEASYEAAVVTLGYTTTATGSNMRNPWSSYPGYTSVQVEDFNRADEQASLAKVSYDFTRLGLHGVTAAGLWVHGWGVQPTTGQNEDEYDLDLQWRPQGERWKGLWFRWRQAYVRQRGGDHNTLDDYRLIVNYDFEAL
jgi:hypothetical protein